MKRTGLLDLVRIISAVAVIVLHVFSNAVNNVSEEISQMSLKICNIIHLELNFAVPLFLMITGSIFLNNDVEYTWSRLKKYLLRFVSCLVSFGLVYSLLFRIYEERSISVVMLVSSMIDIISGELWGHTWYIYMIIGVYLVIPIIKPYFQKNTNKEITVFLEILFLFNAVLPQISDWMGIEIAFYLPITRLYIFYVVIGGLVFKIKNDIKYREVLGAICIVILCICVIIVFGLCQLQNYAGYNSVLVGIYSSALYFVICYFGKDIPSSNWLKELSDLTWGVYLIHPIVINIFTRVFKWNPIEFMPIITFPIMIVVVVVSSFFVVWIMRKIKFVNKYFL